MSEFLTQALHNPVLWLPLLTGVLISISCGVVGTYVVTRRITYLAGGIAHCVLGGMGAARYLSAVHGWRWLTPLHGAIAAALASAVVIGLVSLHAREREDTVIGALWAIGMAVGVLFISKTPGYQGDLMLYLFGDILVVQTRDLWLIGALDVVVVASALLFYNQLQAVCFDEEFSRLRGMRVDLYFLFLLCLTALTVVLLVKVVGIVMVIAMLTLPVAIAGRFARTLWQVMALASLLTMAFIIAGFALSYGPELSPGALIVVLAGAAYFAVMVVTRLAKRHG